MYPFKKGKLKQNLKCFNITSLRTSAIPFRDCVIYQELLFSQSVEWWFEEASQLYELISGFNEAGFLKTSRLHNSTKHWLS